MKGRVYCRLRAPPTHKEDPVASLPHPSRVAGAFCVLLLGALLATCASVTSDPGADATGTSAANVTATTGGQTPTPGQGACQPRVTAPAPVPPSPAPKPIAPQGAASYTNTAVGYSIKYPANWYVSDATPTGGFQILNYTPPNPGTELSPPPYNAIRIDFVENPTRLTPEAHNAANPPFSFREIGVRACWEALSHARVDATPSRWSSGRRTLPMEARPRSIVQASVPMSRRATCSCAWTRCIAKARSHRLRCAR
jgi:hypothetical protein